MLVIRSTLLALVFSGLLLAGGMNTLSAQCCGSVYSANEIGTRLFGLTDASTLGGKTFAPAKPHFAFFNGMHYKRYFTFSAFRLSFRYIQYDLEEEPVCVDCTLRATGKVKGGDLRMGWEYIFVLGPLEPYVGGDVLATIGRYNGKEEGVGATGSYVNLEDNREKWGAGVSPVVGLRFFFGYAVSLSAEMALDAMMTSTRVQRIQSFPESKLESSGTDGSEILFHPVSNFSINVMF